jgi:hypothetical protein
MRRLKHSVPAADGLWAMAPRIAAIGFAALASCLCLTAGASAASVAVWRLYNADGSHFYTARCLDVETYTGPGPRGGYKLEKLAFYIDDAPQAGIVPMFRFLKNQDHFYTTDGFAEGDDYYHLEAVLGYVSKGAAAGKVPLYRAYSAQNGDHFYTSDLNEYNSAMSTSGYKAEGIVGYVNSSGVNPCPTLGGN